MSTADVYTQSTDSAIDASVTAAMLRQTNLLSRISLRQTKPSEVSSAFHHRRAVVRLLTVLGNSHGFHYSYTRTWAHYVHSETSMEPLPAIQNYNTKYQKLMGTLTARVFVKTEIRRTPLDAGARNIDQIQTWKMTATVIGRDLEYE